jgi:hypothetical protein
MAAPIPLSLSFWIVTSSQHIDAVNADIARKITRDQVEVSL